MSYDFGFCFVAVSRRLVYNTTTSASCQHLFFKFFRLFARYTWGSGEREHSVYTLSSTENFLKKVQKSCVKGGFSCFSSKNLAIMDSKS